MESKTRLFGHPIHPMLIIFPAGLFSMAVICDIIYLFNGNSVFSTIAFYDIAGGIIGGLLAAIFGFRDYLAIPSGTRAKGVGLTHGLGNLVVVVLFAISWLVRLNAVNNIPPTLALIFSFLGIILILFTAWMGGELVDRLGVGVTPNANLDAPSSLSSEPVVMPRNMTTSVPVTGERDYQENVDRQDNNEL